MSGEHEYDLDVHADRQSAQVIQIDNGKHVTAVAICASLCGICMVFSLWSAVTAYNAQIDYRVELNHITKLEARIESLEAKENDNVERR